MEGQTYKLAALYKFVPLPDYEEIRDPLFEFCEERAICGTLLLAPEGINGTIAGSDSAIEEVISYLRQDQRIAEGLSLKFGYAHSRPFYRLRVRIKKEIVTFGVPDAHPSNVVGTYVEPKDWNNLIDDPDVIVIDTRNDYEVAIGTFKNAINPKTTSFRQFSDWVDQFRDSLDNPNKKVAMFCTGGIRCEKATSYLLQNGFSDVYHLKGGILKYLEEIPEEKSLWDGECFVFDERVSVSHGLKVGNLGLCRGCRRPIYEEDKKSELYIEGVCCPSCYHEQTEEKRARCIERQKQVRLARERQQKEHLGSQK